MKTLKNHTAKLLLIFSVCFLLTLFLGCNGFSKDIKETPSSEGINLERYTDNGDGTITDRYAGLMMFDSPLKKTMTYDEAEKAINELNMKRFKGYTDWRLPTASEWNKYIIDKTRVKPPTLPDGHPFKNVNTFTYYWSKDSPVTPGKKWVADLSRGKMVEENKNNSFFVWPVRRADID